MAWAGFRATATAPLTPLGSEIRLAAARALRPGVPEARKPALWSPTSVTEPTGSRQSRQAARVLSWWLSEHHDADLRNRGRWRRRWPRSSPRDPCTRRGHPVHPSASDRGLLEAALKVPVVQGREDTVSFEASGRSLNRECLVPLPSTASDGLAGFGRLAIFLQRKWPHRVRPPSNGPDRVSTRPRPQATANFPSGSTVLQHPAENSVRKTLGRPSRLTSPHASPAPIARPASAWRDISRHQVPRRDQNGP